MTIKQSQINAIVYSDYYGELVESTTAVADGNGIQYDTILTLVVLIDLSSNYLSEDIPEEMTSLFGLFSLNLTNNLMTGKVPENIGNLKNLEVLDLSRNQFVGHIPQSLSSLTFLRFLNLSYNNFSGAIPSGTPLQSFPPSSFTGNNQLCGPPREVNCGTTRSRGPNQQDGGDLDNEREYLDDLLLSIGVGFIVGFFGACASLVFIDSLRLAFFDGLHYIWTKLSC